MLGVLVCVARGVAGSRAVSKPAYARVWHAVHLSGGCKSFWQQRLWWQELGLMAARAWLQRLWSQQGRWLRVSKRRLGCLQVQLLLQLCQRLFACPRLRQSPTDPMPACARTAVEKIVCAPVRCACMHVRLMPSVASEGAAWPAHWAPTGGTRRMHACVSACTRAYVHAC